ncbi:MAG: DUF1499 domain-containing protein [Planctomycetota bacterium]
MQRLLPVALTLVALALLGPGLASCSAPSLGVVEGRLTPCPSSPNCVNSFDSDAGAQIDPLAFEGDPDRAWTTVERVVLDRPRASIIDRGDGYLRFEIVSAVLRFRDDLELLLDRENRVIHVRSASRVGYSDLGVNRDRVEALREEFRDALGVTMGTPPGGR